MSRAEYFRKYREKQKESPAYNQLKQQRVIEQREYRRKKKETIQRLVYVVEKALHFAREYEIPRLESLAESALLTVGNKYVK